MLRTMVFPDRLVREARQKMGLTQAELGQRLGMTQSAIAKLERPGVNPTVETLDRVLRATHTRLRISSSPWPEGVDDVHIAARLRLTPDERLTTFERSHRNLRQLAAEARRARPSS